MVKRTKAYLKRIADKLLVSASKAIYVFVYVIYIISTYIIVPFLAVFSFIRNIYHTIFSILHNYIFYFYISPLIALFLFSIIDPGFFVWTDQKAFWIGSTIAQVEAALLAFLGIFILFRAEQLSSNITNIKRFLDDLKDDTTVNQALKQVLPDEAHTEVAGGSYGWALESITRLRLPINLLDLNISAITFPGFKDIDILRNITNGIMQGVDTFDTDIQAEIRGSALGEDGVGFYVNERINTGRGVYNLKTFTDSLLVKAKASLETIIKDIDGYKMSLGAFLSTPLRPLDLYNSRKEGLLKRFKGLDRVGAFWGYSRQEVNSVLGSIESVITTAPEYNAVSGMGMVVRILKDELIALMDQTYQNLLPEVKSFKNRPNRFTIYTKLFLNYAYKYDSCSGELQRLIGDSKTRFVLLATLLGYSIGYLLVVELQLSVSVSTGLIVTFVWFIVTVIRVIYSAFRYG
jgi:hypothetical protein